MRKDGTDLVNTVPPPAGGDVYAADTIVVQAPADVLTELQSSEQEAVLGPDDVELLPPISEQRAVLPSAGIAPTSEVSRTAVPIPQAASWRGRAVWVFGTMFICVLMFLLGHFL
jgi:hypothetical protein